MKGTSYTLRHTGDCRGCDEAVMITCKLQQAWRGECVYEGRIQSASVRPVGVLEGSTARPLFACYVSPFQFCLCIPPPKGAPAEPPPAVMHLLRRDDSHCRLHVSSRCKTASQAPLRAARGGNAEARRPFHSPTTPMHYPLVHMPCGCT